MNKIKIVIAEDNQYFLRGLENLLKESNDLVVCGTAKDGRELVALTDMIKPDVVVTDIEMPVMDGIKSTKMIKERHPDIQVIALTMYNTEELIVEMLRAGARAYLDKNTKFEHLIEAIKAVKEGYYYHCPTTTRRLSLMIAESDIGIGKAGVVFTTEELVIIKHICEEYSTKQIAGLLEVSESAIDKARKKIQDKMGVKTTAGLVAYAISKKLY